MKTARLNIVIDPEEKELAEQLAAEYSRRTGVETTLSSFVRHLIRQAAVDANDGGGLKQHGTPLRPTRPKRPPRPRPSEQVAIYREQIKAIALAHHVTNVRVFGSTARGEDTNRSDLDLLVSPIKGKTGLMELVEIAAKVKKLIKVPVDVVLDTEIPAEHRDRINKEAVAL
ncbi:nucleotidyltransferase domain-containing protein [Geomonas subterranea]|uniref:Nucleotidyltransferase domain-containing protein n=1 Tax=Geomonas subterranea TaxID=2847989 RepID=A0ABX8LJF9_9BACT|nr:nucleotidyltransferase domain-containing protein [Geomonas subterranea]QXE91021.1 nucleotidyltransferase domain-containing protein [Geomonas subterranea]QXM10894.1 nucleotidyltransferase domain-containing protein [Geomonas subterranea]